MAGKDGIRKAKDFYKKAIEEYKRAKEEQSDILFRDAGEKGWNAVVLATNYKHRPKNVGCLKLADRI